MARWRARWHLGRDGELRVPGYCRTAMVMAIPQAVREQIVAGIPWGAWANRTKSPASCPSSPPRMRAFITGANIPVNGGYFMDF